ncbi:MAG: class II fructose-bisphosphate aldolase [Oscillospiraceae bacterium]|nr:class II fructose-bisphosphate aldolase [Oscillospiraceae bacterium]
MLVNMKEILETAEREGYAIPCINTPNVETIRAVVGAAEELNTPVIIDHAEVHDIVVPMERIAPDMIKYAKAAKVPVCVHLDHGTDYNFLMRAIRAGFTSIMYDCSALPFEKNVQELKDFTKIAHGLGITVEAELGIMASSEEDTHGGEALTNAEIRKFFTDPDEAGKFAEITGVDALTVCFGSMHGIYAEPPVLDIDLVKSIRKSMPAATKIVMHGASGVAFSEVKKAIDAGCCKVNYYSYLAKDATEFVGRTIQEMGPIAYHELTEYAYEHMKEHAKAVLKAFRNGK